MPFPLALGFTILFAFLSHFVVDSFAKVTYHTPEPHRDDKFWVTWGIVSTIITIALVIWVLIIGMFWFFFLGGFFSVLVDIVDWGILRPYQNKKNKGDQKSIWEQGYFFHTVIDIIREKVPPFSWLPNWNYERKGVVPEIIIIIILWILVATLLISFSVP